MIEMEEQGNDKAFMDFIVAQYNTLGTIVKEINRGEFDINDEESINRRAFQNTIILHQKQAFEEMMAVLSAEADKQETESIQGFWSYLGNKYTAENLKKPVNENLKDSKWLDKTQYIAQGLYMVFSSLITKILPFTAPILASFETVVGVVKKPIPEMDTIEEKLKNPDVIVHLKEERQLKIAIQKASMVPMYLSLTPFLLTEAAEVSSWVKDLLVNTLGAQTASVGMAVSLSATYASFAILQWGMVVLLGFQLHHAAKKSTLEGVLEDRVNKLTTVLTRLEDKTIFIDPANREKLIAQKKELETEINSALNIANVIVNDPNKNTKENGWQWSNKPVTEAQINSILEPLKKHYQHYDQDALKKVNVENWNNPESKEISRIDELRISRILEKQRSSHTGLFLSLFGYIAMAVAATMFAAMTIIGAPVVLPVLGVVATMAPTLLMLVGLGLNITASITNSWDRQKSDRDRENLFIAELENLIPKGEDDSPRAKFINLLKEDMSIEAGKRSKNTGLIPSELMEEIKNDHELFQVLDENRKAWPALLKNTVNWNTQKDEWIKEFKDYKDECEKVKPSKSVGFFSAPNIKKTPEEMLIIDKMIEYFKDGDSKKHFPDLSDWTVEQKQALYALSKDKEFSSLIKEHKNVLPKEFMEAWNDIKASGKELTNEANVIGRFPF